MKTELINEIILYQNDFSEGTYIINSSGRYVLGENISFKPNPASSEVDAYTCCFPKSTQFTHQGGKYDPAAFGIGFFAAIVISGTNVELDLNNYTIEQSKEHYLLMRFFSVIELSDRPFIPTQGPFNFGDSIVSAENVTIKNGIIGLSSHHGIHCNACKNVVIENVDFKNFEIAAVALNGVEGLEVTNVKAESATDVPIYGTFSAAQFIKPFINYLYDQNSNTNLSVNGSQLYIGSIREKLKEAINNVYEDLITDNKNNIDKVKHPDEFALFHNKEGVSDGNVFAFLINDLGVAVFGHGLSGAAHPSSNVLFKNITVENNFGNTREIPALRNNQGAAVIDPVGAVFQIMNKDPDGSFVTIDNNLKYKGTILSNAQALVAKARSEFPYYLDVSRNAIDDEVLKWVENVEGYETLNDLSYMLGHPGLADVFMCGGDSMLHVAKGVLTFRIESSNNITLDNVNIHNTANIGVQGTDVCGVWLEGKQHPRATLIGYNGSVAKGIAISGCTTVNLKDITINGISALSGSATGIAVITDSEKVYIDGASIEGVTAGSNFEKESTAVTIRPDAVGVYLAENAIEVDISSATFRNITAGYSDAESINIIDVGSTENIGQVQYELGMTCFITLSFVALL